MMDYNMSWTFEFLEHWEIDYELEVDKYLLLVMFSLKSKFTLDIYFPEPAAFCFSWMTNLYLVKHEIRKKLSDLVFSIRQC